MFGPFHPQAFSLTSISPLGLRENKTAQNNDGLESKNRGSPPKCHPLQQQTIRARGVTLTPESGVLTGSRGWSCSSHRRGKSIERSLGRKSSSSSRREIRRSFAKRPLVPCKVPNGALPLTHTILKWQDPSGYLFRVWGLDCQRSLSFPLGDV